MEGSYILSAMVSFCSGVLLAGWCFRSPRNVLRAAHSLAFNENVKMVLVVRKDLKMGTGKIAAQCCHAAVAVIEEVAQEENGKWRLWLDSWKNSGSAKVALHCESETRLLELRSLAMEADLPHYVVKDAGRTQIAAGSRTVLAIGPAPAEKIDEITGCLKLL